MKLDGAFSMLFIFITYFNVMNNNKPTLSESPAGQNTIFNIIIKTSEIDTPTIQQT